MRAISLIILFLGFVNSYTYAGNILNSSSSAIKFKPSSLSPNDTAVINTFIRKGEKSLSSNKADLDLVKTCIDSAVLICNKKNIDIPSSLNLLLAEYHYATGDLRSASEEAAIALKKSAGSGESRVLARTNIFLGKYYLRTGFYAESLEYLNNAITIAKKDKIKGMIPSVYYGQYNVYRTIGDLKGERQNLQLMIDAAYNENDTASSDVDMKGLAIHIWETL